MSLELWLAFVCAVTVLLVIPGPTVLLLVGHSLTHGRRMASRSVLGVLSGDCMAMSLSLAGLGAVLAASSQAFAVMKWGGALYLIALGLQRWWAAVRDEQVELQAAPAKGRTLYAQALVVTALNPKGIVFYVALFPQFIDRHAEALPQIVLLGATFLTLAALNATMYVLLADRMRAGLSSARRRRVFNGLGGTALVGAGLLTATLQRR